MAIKIENRFVVEDIIDEKGNKLGEVKFDPNDSRIMSKIIKIVDNLEDALKEVNAIDAPDINLSELSSTEDFVKAGEAIKKLSNAYNIELSIADSIINDLIEVFGEETINLFTQGTKNMYSVLPLVNFVIPYVQEEEKKRVEKYMPKNNADVME